METALGGALFAGHLPAQIQFTPPQTISTGSTAATDYTECALGNLDGQYAKDMVVSAADGLQVRFAQNCTCGSFGPAITVPVPGTTHHTALAVANLYGGGTDEIAVLIADAITGPWSRLRIYSMSGTTPVLLQDVPLPAYAEWVDAHLRVADIDGDGDLDLLAVDMIGAFVVVRNQSSTSPSFVAGSLQGLPRPALDALLFDAQLADFDGDGQADLVAQYSQSLGQQSYVPQLAWTRIHRAVNGMFEMNIAAERVLQSPPNGMGMTFLASQCITDDFDGDGIRDLVVASVDLMPSVVLAPGPGLHLIRGLGGFSFGNPIALPFDPTLPAGAFGLAAADFDGDGDLDIVYRNQAGTTLIRPNDGAGAFPGTGQFAEVVVSNTTWDLRSTAVDADWDGRPDLVLWGDVSGIPPRHQVAVLCNLTPVTGTRDYAAFVFERTSQMLAIQSNNGRTRADNTVAAAKAEIRQYFAEHRNAKVVLYECFGNTVRSLPGCVGACYTDADSAIEALAMLNPITIGSPATKPLGNALCSAKDALVALDNGANPLRRSLYVYACKSGLQNFANSPCPGAAPNAAIGTRCPQMPADPRHPTAFSTPSWQSTVCTLLYQSIRLHVHYWDDFTDTPSDLELLSALCDLTGGSLYRTWDSSTGPVENPFHLSGSGCQDSLGTTLSMTHEGTPQPGETIQIGCRSSSALPYVLGVGFQNTSLGTHSLPLDLTPFGAPGCTLYSSWDVTDAFLGWHGLRAMSIPAAPALIGLSLFYQGLVPSAANNLGIATSNLLKVTIAP